jgi:protein gp37
MTKIEWADKTWNPIVGCSLKSPGCTHCYAMRMAARLERMGAAHYAGLTQATKAGAVWTGP